MDAERDRSPDVESVRARERAVYIISVAAELAGVHPQTLRIYERKGLVQPRRTPGNSRRYSQRDIERLRDIQDLTQDRGINLAGVKMIIDLQAELDVMRERVAELEGQLRSARRAAQKAQARREQNRGQIVPMHAVFLPPWQSGTDT
jgi:MerR family transcriptional regulator/heat shock protein HspR